MYKNSGTYFKRDRKGAKTENIPLKVCFESIPDKGVILDQFLLEI